MDEKTNSARDERQWLIEDLFDAIRALPVEMRQARLAAAEVSDDVRAEVASLLDFDGDTVHLTRAVGTNFDSLQPASCIGVSVDGFTIHAVIGTGGMGTVFEAEQERPQRRVAIKVLGVTGARVSAIRRFLQESAFLARLDHPNIARVIAAGILRSADGVERPYFAMELVEGGCAMTRWARESRASRSAILAKFAEVCDAVGSGHRSGIAHLDLKPSNLLVGSDGRVRVIDYGIARSLDQEMSIGADAVHTNERGIVGTPQYMSPEQFVRDRRALDSRTDVYALGLVLFELVTGRLPYDTRGCTLTTIAKMVRESVPPSPRQVDSNIPRALAAIVQRAIAKNPESRYGTASELADDIRRFLRDEPIVAAPATRLESFARFVRKNKAFSAAAAFALVASIGAAVVTVQSAVNSANSATRSARIASLANLRAATAALREGDPAEATRHLDRVRAAERGWESRHLVASIARHELYAPIDGEILHLAVASETGEIACGVSGGFVVIVDPKRPEPYELHDLRKEFGDAANPFFPTMTISADGRRVLAPLGTSRLLELDRNRGVWSEFPVAGPWCADADGATIVADTSAIMFVPRGKVVPSARVAFGGTPIALSIARGGRFAAVLLADGAVVLYDINTAAGSISQRWRSATIFRQPRTLVVADDGSAVIAVSRDPELVRLHGTDGTVVRRAELAGGTVFELAYSRNGETVAASSWANTIRVIDAHSLEIREFLAGTLGHVWGIDFSSDDSCVVGRVIVPLAVPRDDRTQMEWIGGYRIGQSGATRDIDVGRELLAADPAWAQHCIWVVASDGLLGTVDVSDGVWTPLGAVGADVRILKRMRDGFIVGTTTGAVARFDLVGEGTLVERWRKQVFPTPLTTIDVSPDGTAIACGTRERTAVLLDATTGNERWRCELPRGKSGPERQRVSGFGFLDDGRSVVPFSVDAGTYVPVLSMTDGRLLRRFSEESVEVESVLPVADSAVVAAGVTGALFLCADGRPIGSSEVARNGGLLGEIAGDESRSGHRILFAARDGLLRVVAPSFDGIEVGNHKVRFAEDVMRLDLPTGVALVVGFDTQRDEVVVLTNRGRLRAWSGRADPATNPDDRIGQLEALKRGELARKSARTN